MSVDFLFHFDDLLLAVSYQLSAKRHHLNADS